MKKLLPFLPFAFALLMAVALYGEDVIYERIIGHPQQPYEYEWADSLGKTDTAQFDGTGLNDASAAGAYIGEADSVFVVEIMDVDPTTADTIMWGAAEGSDTTGVIWRDTAVIPVAPDSIDLGTGVYFAFTDSAGHTTGDRWMIPVYADDEDTVGTPNPIRIWKSMAIIHSEVYQGTAANDDSVIIRYQRAKSKNSTDWVTYKADTISAATLADTIDNFLAIDSNSYLYEWMRVLYLVRGEEVDTTKYYFYGEIIFK